MRSNVAVRYDVRPQRAVGRIHTRAMGAAELLARMVFLVAAKIQGRFEAGGLNETISINSTERILQPNEYLHPPAFVATELAFRFVRLQMDLQIALGR